jgi:PEP-CTERM motif
MRPREILKKIHRQVRIGIVAMALIVGFSSSARAVLVDFNGGDAGGVVDVGSLDWNVSSFLAQNGVQAIAAFQQNPSCTTACQFTVLTHATLSSVNNTQGTTQNPTGLNTGYEISFVAKFTEQVSAVTSNTAEFKTVTGVPVVLEIYFDPARNANPLNGSGFNDGRLILSSTLISDSTGRFGVTSTTPVPLDQFTGNNYGSQNTVTGSGGQDPIFFGNLATDPTFFIQALAAFGIDFSNISTSLPFLQTNPSVCFNQTAAAVAVGGTAVPGTGLDCEDAVQFANQPYSGQGGVITDGGYVPRIGPTNGLFFPDFPDFIAQTDANAAFIAAVPEPASFLLFGLGLIGMGGYLRARTRKTK